MNLQGTTKSVLKKIIKYSKSTNLFQKQRLKQNLVAYSFLAVPLLLLGIFTFYPLIQGIYLSFLDYQITNNPQLGGPIDFIRSFAVNFGKLEHGWLFFLFIFVELIILSVIVIRKVNKKIFWSVFSCLLLITVILLGNTLSQTFREINYSYEEDRTISNEMVPQYIDMLKEQYNNKGVIIKERVNSEETRVYVKRSIWVGLTNYRKIIPNPQFAEFVTHNYWYVLLFGTTIICIFLLIFTRNFRKENRSLDRGAKIIAGLMVAVLIVISWPKLFHSQTWPFYEALKNSLKYVAVVPPIQIASILLAVMVNRKLKGITFFRTLYYVPVITGVVIIGYCWKFIYQPNGLLDSMFSTFGLHSISWLGDRRIALFSVMFVTFWRGLGYYMVLYLAGLQDIPGDVIEAAKIDGVSPFQMIVKIYMPLLRRSILVCTVLSTISALRVFEEIYIMAAGSTGSTPMNGTVTMVYMIYDKAFGQFGLQFSYSAALAVILSVFIAVFTAVYFRVEGRYEK